MEQQNTGTQAEQIEDALLGRGVEVPLDGGRKVIVHPIGVRHLRKFSASIANGLSVVSALISKSPPNASERDLAAAIVPALVPVVLVEFLDLVSECCTPRIDDLPHWELLPIITTWLELNFAEGRYRPFADLLEFLLVRAKTLQTQSNSSSPADTPSETSSSESN
jgi:hypothetical protein